MPPRICMHRVLLLFHHRLLLALGGCSVLGTELGSETTPRSLLGILGGQNGSLRHS